MKGKISSRDGILYCVLYYSNANGYQQKWISTGLKERGNLKKAEKILEAKLIEFAYLETDIPKTKKEEKNSILFVDWLDDYIKKIRNDVSAHTYSIYRDSYPKTFHAFWDDKNLLLENVNENDILAFYDYLKETRKVKNITLKHYSSILRPALRLAVKEKLLYQNPYDFMPAIKKEKCPHDYFNQSEMEEFFKIIKGHKLELAFKVLAYYGLRRSELIGLQWSSIDFVNKKISINHTVLTNAKEIIVSDKMKTASSNRTLPLIPEIEKALIKQQEKIKKNKTYYGINYKTKYENFVFVNEIGNLILPDFLSHQFNKVLKTNNIKHIRLHDLRHSCASIMLANGVQMKQIQEWLGHSNFNTTADVYSHLDFSSKLNSAETISKALNTKTEISTESAKLGELNEKAKQLGFNNIEELVASLSNKTLL